MEFIADDLLPNILTGNKEIMINNQQCAVQT